ncbi:hypothetical protein CC86DRAFT_408202 [Ophiobolus disseminans]|uniref:Uncharacterized protein n=1 Tax=Ophiobolus disseminans TaxID=1469910 RepID=A0A6A6ZW50_9PLEO|nr:hypothetical protein CC86DRAFT_408202 [Ophiobolus disseminans]
MSPRSHARDCTCLDARNVSSLSRPRRLLYLTAATSPRSYPRACLYYTSASTTRLPLRPRHYLALTPATSPRSYPRDCLNAYTYPTLATSPPSHGGNISSLLCPRLLSMPTPTSTPATSPLSLT